MKKNLLLVFSSIFVSLLLIEGGLRLTGWKFQKENQKPASVDFKDTPEFLVVTLGESTSAEYGKGESWPTQLQKRLLSEGYNIKVLNLAISAASSSFLVASFFKHEEAKNADLVIAMMGINDFFSVATVTEEIKSSFWLDLRVVKLIRWLRKSLSQRKYQPVDNLSMVSTREEKVRDLELYRSIGFDGFKSRYPELSSCELARRLANIIQVANRYKDFDFSRGAITSDLAYRVLKLCTPLTEGQFWFFHTLGRYPEKEDREIQLAKKILRDHGIYLEDRTLTMAIPFFGDSMPSELEEILRVKGLEGSHKAPGEILKENYDRIRAHLAKKGAKLVAMEYATRSIDNIKSLLAPLDQSNIIYLDNQSNFQNALKKRPKEEIFLDYFAGSWGHTTAEGHRLIADRVYPVVLKQYRNKKKGD